ncbi:hypothetical protein ANANG_G00047620 [Anguilla anguilla]|uniref:Phosphoglycerate mutase n=1 Tax=Anguilla anguilla TaxID=7936 RepID=A0A9D3S862_ANGAN|nr:hypothetical protein ANANG_G00047620 [Anguilla anguilla]
MAAYKLVLIRHGESSWNQENRFCGWFDADLSETGVREAKRGGEALKDAGYEFDVCYTSAEREALRGPDRAQQGRDGRQARGGAGQDLEAVLRHPPPTMDPDHDYYTNISKDRRYADLTEEQLPSCESLKDTIARALPFWNEEIVPQIKEGKRVLIAAHGNSLRGIVKHLEGMSEEAIMELNLPTGIPILYELDKNLKPVKPMQFLGDEETVRKAMEAVAAQGKAKK